MTKYHIFKIYTVFSLLSLKKKCAVNTFTAVIGTHKGVNCLYSIKTTLVSLKYWRDFREIKKKLLDIVRDTIQIQVPYNEFPLYAI